MPHDCHDRDQLSREWAAFGSRRSLSAIPELSATGQHTAVSCSAIDFTVHSDNTAKEYARTA